MEKSSTCSSTLKDTREANKTSLWKIRKVLTEKCERWIYFDNNSDVENYILKPLCKSINLLKRDPIKIKIDDYDMGYQDENMWRVKELDVGDEVGFFYDPIAKNMCFSVLKQAKP
ncbi:BnaA03g59030D [Brassica napus]|nr:BnaA03g59030D [Brassica napus]